MIQQPLETAKARYAGTNVIAAPFRRDGRPMPKPVQEQVPQHIPAPMPRRRQSIWPDVRECCHCDGVMTGERYKRRFLRFFTVYRCSECEHGFTQDTRGFQGFYFGLMLAGGGLASLIPLATASVRQGIALATLAVIMLAWPLVRNWLQYWRQPVVARPRGHRLLEKSSGRNVGGRILGGDSRLMGFALSVVSLAAFAGLAMTAVVAAAAVGIG